MKNRIKRKKSLMLYKTNTIELKKAPKRVEILEKELSALKTMKINHQKVSKEAK